MTLRQQLLKKRLYTHLALILEDKLRVVVIKQMNKRQFQISATPQIEVMLETPVVLQMVAVGEESGAIDDMMEEVADLYQREVEYELKTLSSQIEPILIIALGIMVLILALGVFLPMWDLGKTMIKK